MIKLYIYTLWLYCYVALFLCKYIYCISSLFLKISITFYLLVDRSRLLKPDDNCL